MSYPPEAGRANIVRPYVHAFDVKPPQNQATLVQDHFRHDFDRSDGSFYRNGRNRALGLLTDEANDHRAVLRKVRNLRSDFNGAKPAARMSAMTSEQI